MLQAKPEIFSRNAANMPFPVFSILEYLFREQFQFSRPYIAKINVEIGKPIERLHELIYSEDEFRLSDISEFNKENHLQFQSMIEFINSINDKYLMKNIDTIISIEKAGITEEVVNKIETLIHGEIEQTIPIRNLVCISYFPKIKCDWSEWLIYSILFKWSSKLEVALSSSQLKQSIPLVAPTGKMNTTPFKNASTSPISIKVDDLENIDELISDLITDNLLEDI